MRRLVLVAIGFALLGSGCFIAITPEGIAVGVAGVVVQPAYTYIPSTSIAVVSNASGDVFYYNNVYWRHWNGYWWRSSIWNGGWARVTVVPDAFLGIPTWHSKYNVVRNHPGFGSHPGVGRPPARGIGRGPHKPATPARPVVKGPPGKGSPGKGWPGKGSPGKGSPGKGSPGKGSPGKGSPGKGSSGKGSALKEFLKKAK